MQLHPLLRFGGILLYFVASAGTITRSTLQTAYAERADGLFEVKPGLTIKAVYGSKGAACVLTISGPSTYDEVMKIFNKIAPPEMRGKESEFSRLEWCVGACSQSFLYANVDFTTGLVFSQASEPDAIIEFKRKECTSAVTAAKKIVLHITR